MNEQKESASIMDNEKQQYKVAKIMAKIALRIVKKEKDLAKQNEAAQIEIVVIRSGNND
jgi:hypothetical protein